MSKRELGECEIVGCPNQAEYSIYKICPNGEKRWIRVCSEHEKIIGNDNILEVK